MSNHYDSDQTRAYPVSQAATETFVAGPAFTQPASDQGFRPSADFTRRAQDVPLDGKPVLPGAASASDDRSTWPHALADGMAVGSLVLSLLGFGVIGIVLGSIHASNAHKLRQRSSAVGAWGIGIGIAGTLAWVLVIILVIAAGVAASHAASTYPYGG